MEHLEEDVKARNKLMALMGANRRLAEKVADEILNDHAHELAEAICALGLTRSETATAEEMQAYLDSAALIRPKVES